MKTGGFFVYNRVMATKYLQVFNEMVTKYEKEFDAFQEIHNNYMKDAKKWEKEFNEKGKEIVDIIREYENRLCSKMERTANSTYSANLAEKFRAEIKKYLPKIDLVGVKITFN